MTAEELKDRLVASATALEWMSAVVPEFTRPSSVAGRRKPRFRFLQGRMV